jgi:hypothetical protein
MSQQRVRKLRAGSPCKICSHGIKSSPQRCLVLNTAEVRREIISEDLRFIVQQQMRGTQHGCSHSGRTRASFFHVVPSTHEIASLNDEHVLYGKLLTSSYWQSVLCERSTRLLLPWQ